ncbi:hypothetical protein QEN19_003249 [Hanseniaspora menglaensis]
MHETQISKVSNIIAEMGGKFHIDFPKTTNILIIDINNLSSYETILKSLKYKYVLEKKLDTVILDFETLKYIHGLYLANDMNKIHPLLAAGGNSNNIKNDEFLKHIVLNLLRIKYTVRPFDLLKNKSKIFFGKYKDQDNISNYVKLIKENMSDTKFIKLDIKENCYMTQLDDDSREKCLFITELNYGARLDAAKKDRVPVIHIQWLKDVLKRKMMLSYKPYLLNNITSKSSRELNERMMANRSWKNTDLNVIENDLTLARQIFDEYEVIDNKVIIKKNLKSKLNNTIWDKIVNNEISVSEKSIHSNDVTRSTDHDVSMLKMKSEAPARQDSILPPETQQDYFKNCHIKAFGFSDTHNKVLEKTFKKSQCITFRAYSDEDNHSNGINELMQEFSKLDIDFINEKKCIFVIPFSYDLSKLPVFLLKKYKETLSYLDNGTFDWHQAHSFITTEFYLERCLYYKKTIQPDAWSIPFFNSRLNIKHFKNSSDKKETYLWTTTGFEGVEFLHLNKVINLYDSLEKQTNFLFSKNLNYETDLLVVNLSKLMAMKATKKGPLYDKSNKYTSLFIEEEKKILSELNIHNTDSVDLNKFLLKKLNFIKNSKTHIASVTPGFLFEIFHQFNISILNMDADENSNNLKVNDKRWCITCPQTSLKLSLDQNDLVPVYERYIFKINNSHNEPTNSTQTGKRKLEDNDIPNLLLKKSNKVPFNRPESLHISPNAKSNQSSPEKINLSNRWRSRFLNGGGINLSDSGNQILSKRQLASKNDDENLVPETDEDSLSAGSTSLSKYSGSKEQQLSSQISYGFGKSRSANGIPQLAHEPIRPKRRITRQSTKTFEEINTADV